MNPELWTEERVMGVEPTTATLATWRGEADNPGNSRVRRATSTRVAHLLPADLNHVVEAWPNLSEAIRRAVLTLVRAAGSSS